MDYIDYKTMLIDNILEWQTHNQFSRSDLERMTIRVLERIFDNV